MKSILQRVGQVKYMNKADVEEETEDKLTPHFIPKCRVADAVSDQSRGMCII